MLRRFQCHLRHRTTRLDRDTRQLLGLWKTANKIRQINANSIFSVVDGDPMISLGSHGLWDWLQVNHLGFPHILFQPADDS